MASSCSLQKSSFLVLLSVAIFFSTTFALNSSSPSPSTTTPGLNSTHFPLIRSICKSTPYPDFCFNSLKLSISININPNIITFVLQILQNAISEAGKLSDLLVHLGNTGIIEQQIGIVQDCKDLHEITISSLQKTVSRIQSSPNKRNLSDANAFLSAALTNKNTCLEDLDSANGPSKPVLVNSIITTYKHVSNSLSLLSKADRKSKAGKNNNKNRRLLGRFPAWLTRKSRRILEDSDDNEYDPSEVITVAKDGSGNFTTVSDAIEFAPSDSYDRIIIYVKEGVYHENVEISKHKTNIVLLGDGSDVTVITGKRSVVGGYTTFRSATVAVAGDGFLARDITFENTAGPVKHQAVALRINADLAAVYRCNIHGYQDTLYVHSFRQFYRECNISGTVDFIFGNAAVVFQGCNIIARLPKAGQFNAITAHSRDSPDQNTGISIQNCSILASEDLFESNMDVKSYLGRPWKEYARTVYMESYIDDLISPLGWKEWEGNSGLDTLYYGEYENTGPGSGTDNRVTWKGYNVMNYDDALSYAVSELITGDEWLESTSFPYQDGI
ncbi:Pectinesterase [Macleaya cordata]|uniref:Pectinesterase n=1 Tax=Macleaya cordata TaxID=56857 RepID=A0A200PVA1_MACCD|nr:Pectinesterase [Macleaya cordata]